MDFQEIAFRAARQHGLAEREWLRQLGVNPSQLQRWLDTGRIEIAQRGVYRIAGAPVTWEQRLLAAVLSAGDGAVASHRSAARLWRLLDGDALDVSVPDTRRRRLRGARLYSSTDLAGATVHGRSAIPTTSPLRTLVDLGSVIGPVALEDALDRALVTRLVTVAGVEHALDQVARRGRPGVASIRAVLNDRALGAERPDGLLEPRMARLLRDFGLPAAVFQYEIRHNGRLVARVDFSYPALRLVIEVDGWETRASPRALQAELDRQNALVALGWRVIRFTWADVVRRPHKVAAALQGVLSQLTSA